jgi:hypothetical protein
LLARDSAGYRLKAAGAVLVAKLVSGSLAYDDIWYGGRTRNPWNIEEFSTGSSAGPAACTSAGIVQILSCSTFSFPSICFLPIIFVGDCLAQASTPLHGALHRYKLFYIYIGDLHFFIEVFSLQLSVEIVVVYLFGGWGKKGK